MLPYDRAVDNILLRHIFLPSRDPSNSVARDRDSCRISIMARPAEPTPARDRGTLRQGCGVDGFQAAPTPVSKCRLQLRLRLDSGLTRIIPF